MAPAANKQVTSIKIAVAVIAPAERFQHPDKPVQNAQNTEIKLSRLNQEEIKRLLLNNINIINKFDE